MELAYTSKQNSDSAVGAKPLLLYPEDVLSLLKDRNMTRQAKQEMLADWASDARTIADAPSLRRLDNGAVIRIDVILEALARLDAHPFRGLYFDLGAMFRSPCQACALRCGQDTKIHRCHRKSKARLLGASTRSI